MANLYNRTDVEQDADGIDCDLFRIVTRTERLYDRIKRKQPAEAAALHKALMALRGARVPIRALMQEADRNATV